MFRRVIGSNFRILLEILSSPRDLPLDRFWTHVSYILLVYDATSGGSMDEVILPSIKPYVVCHGYWQMAHMHASGCVSQSSCPHWLLTLVRHYKCCFVDL